MGRRSDGPALRFQAVARLRTGSSTPPDFWLAAADLDPCVAITRCKTLNRLIERARHYLDAYRWRRALANRDVARVA